MVENHKKNKNQLLNYKEQETLGCIMMPSGFLIVYMLEKELKDNFLISIIIVISFFYSGLKLYHDASNKKSKEERKKKEKDNFEKQSIEFELKANSSNLNDPNDLFWLAEAFENGYGVERDPVLASKLYRGAALNGHVQSMYEYAKYILNNKSNITNNKNLIMQYLEVATMNLVLGAREDLEEFKKNEGMEYSDKYLAWKMEIYDSIQFNNLLIMLKKCESEPEKILLQSLVKIGKLFCSGEYCFNEKFRLKNQVNISRYRVDFLINDKFIIEVDGKAYHNNEKSFRNDRIRDQNLLELGYYTSRYAASQIYENPDRVAEKILKIALKSNIT